MIVLEPIAYVRNQRRHLNDDFWGDTVSTIELIESLDGSCFDGLETFSHVEVIFYFDQVDETKIMRGARHPRNNPNFPQVGIFAQRAKNRPNRLGLTIAKIVRRDGRQLIVQQLDAIDGTPILDIKPVMREFLAHDEIKQPAWSSELMQDYWK